MAHRFLYLPTLDVSFVIATFNRGAVLVDCLRRTLGCGLAPGRFEIIVVDNASTDGTAELVGALPGVELIRGARNDGPVAKNVGIARARGRFIVLLDDDAYPVGDAIGRMIAHFESDPALGAAVFDVTLPNGMREGSAYESVFIGAGTGLRRVALERVGFLPPEFFMQAEEYDLSLRLLDAGYVVRRFADLPLVHLKSPTARIAERTTRLDVRNNLYLLAKYIPAPLCHTLAAEWLSRYWLMAAARDRSAGTCGHRRGYVEGAAEGLQRWGEQRRAARRVKPETVEAIFQYHSIERRMGQAIGAAKRIALVDLGKNIFAFWRAARALGVEVVAIADDGLGGAGATYRDIPIVSSRDALELRPEALILTHMSTIHAERRTASWPVKSGVPMHTLLADGQ